jgi:glycosyltransferase involved in cell wall biosynthesis
MDSRMNILQLTWSRMDSYGGIQTCVRSLEKAFAALGCSVHTWSLPWHGTADERPPEESGCLPLSDFHDVLDGLIADCRIGGIISHNLHHRYGPGISEAVARCARLHNIPHLILVHDVGPVGRHQPGVCRHICLEILIDAHVSVTSRFNFEAFSKRFREPDSIVPPGIDFDDFHPSEEPNHTTIAYPGRITRQKGMVRAIQVLGMLTNEVGPLEMLLSARGRNCSGESGAYFSELDETAARYPGLKVSFLSAMDPVQRVYQRSVATLVLSEDEGFGLVPLESLACHRPVVAWIVGGMSWLKGVPGVLCIETPDNAHDAIVRVLFDAQRWRVEAGRAREQLKGEYDIRSIACRHLSTLEWQADRSASQA